MFHVIDAYLMLSISCVIIISRILSDGASPLEVTLQGKHGYLTLVLNGLFISIITIRCVASSDVVP